MLVLNNPSLFVWGGGGHQIVQVSRAGADPGWNCSGWGFRVLEKAGP